jgi:hypothetical protein
MGGVRAHACLGSPISDIPFGHLGVIESMEMVNVAPGKRTLINWERHNWVEYASFGVGQVGEDRGHRLDIDFVNSGSRTILKSTELKPAASLNPDFRFPRPKSLPQARLLSTQ